MAAYEVISVGDRDARLPAIAAADSANVSSRAASTAAANSLKAPTRSTVRASLRASLVTLGPVLTSSGTGRTRRPFHSHPYRLVRQSMRVGMKGAARSSPPRRSKHRRSEYNERRGAQRAAAVRASRGFQAVCGGSPSHSGRGFQAGGGPGRCCGGFHAVCGCGDGGSPNGSHGSRTDGSNDGHTLLCHGDSC